MNYVINEIVEFICIFDIKNMSRSIFKSRFFFLNCLELPRVDLKQMIRIPLVHLQLSIFKSVFSASVVLTIKTKEN